MPEGGPSLTAWDRYPTPTPYCVSGVLVVLRPLIRSNDYDLRSEGGGRGLDKM